MTDQPDPATSNPKQAPPTARIGPLEIDVPRSIGYFGAIALAVAFEVIEPPVGLFIAAVPLFKLLQQRQENEPTRFLGAILEGAAKPVGGDTEATIRLAPSSQAPEWQDDAPDNGGGKPNNARRHG